MVWTKTYCITRKNTHHKVYDWFFAHEAICAEVTRCILAVPKRQQQLLSVTHSAFD